MADQKMTNTPVLLLEDVRHAYNETKVLRDVSLSVAPGELVCLVGPSGCGKSTTLRLVAGLETLERGRILIDGEIVSGEGVHRPAEQRNVGLMFQDYALFPHLTVMQNVTFGLNGQSAATRRERGRAVLAEVEMEAYAESYPHMLSGGQQQRAALARALAPQPRLMLLDEPFSGLDSQLRGQVRDDTMHILKGSGAGTLMITHDPEEAMFMADRIVVMKDGRVEQVDGPADIYCKPASPFVTSFFSEVNRLRGRVSGGVVETPVGNVQAKGLADGLPVDVLIRPEALRLETPCGRNDECCSVARVIAARMLGRSSLVHLSLAAQEGEVHLHSRMPGRFLPREDEVMEITLDNEQTFIFPVDSTK